ncbi:MAG: hypothetical protein IVW51_15425 [Thermaceae bacterium]|nr:hypothetical protein [Thermaceae bacterium]
MTDTNHLSPYQFAALNRLEVTRGEIWLYKAILPSGYSKGGLSYPNGAAVLDYQWQPTYTYLHGIFLCPTAAACLRWAKREKIALVQMLRCRVHLDDILVLDAECVKTPHVLEVVWL